MSKNNVIKDLKMAKAFLCHPEMLNVDMRIKIGQVISTAIALLEEQEGIVNDVKMDIPQYSSCEIQH